MTDPLTYIQATWPETKLTPHSGAQWDAIADKVIGLLDVYTADQIVNAVQEWCKAHPTTRFSADKLGALMAELYPSVSPFGVVSPNERWCDDAAYELLSEAIGNMSDDDRDALRVQSGGVGRRAVCEWLCRERGLLAAVALVRRGAPTERLASCVRVVCGVAA